MSKPNPWRWMAVPLSYLLLAVGGPGRSQTPPAADPFRVPPARMRSCPPQVPKPAARSVDDLVAQLAKVRQQPAEPARQAEAASDADPMAALAH